MSQTLEDDEYAEERTTVEEDETEALDELEAEEPELLDEEASESLLVDESSRFAWHTARADHERRGAERCVVTSSTADPASR